MTGPSCERDDASLAPPAHAFRPDIDGLRAIAVLAVVVFHAFPELLPGGFVGVDIFFVISGYLISGIIVDGMASDRFSLLGFYRRRIHRIFPALAVVLASLLLVGYVYFFSDEYQLLGKHTLCGSLFAQNIALSDEIDYFDVAAHRKPLLHLWSLAIEEQFYIAYPLLLIILKRLGLPLLASLATLGVAAFACNVVFIDLYATTVFYSTGTRAWELLVGGGIALIHRSPRSTVASWMHSAIGRQILSIGGLGLIGLSAWWFSRGLVYPGWWAIVPVLSTAMVIAAGPQVLLNRGLLGNPVVTYIGRISYPFYLWHWPLLAVCHLIHPEGVPALTRALAVLTALILAILTYHLLEQRLRRSPSRVVTGGLIASAAMLAIVGGLGFVSVIEPRHADNAFDAIVRRADRDWTFPGEMVSRQIGNRWCHFAGGSGPKTLFWGDSHMEQYGPRILELLKKGRASPQRGIIFVTGSGLTPLPGVRNRVTPSITDDGYEAFRLLVAAKDVDSVVITARWTHYFTAPSDYAYEKDGASHDLGSSAGRSAAFAEFEALVSRLADEGKTVYLVLDIPYGPQLEPKYIFKRSLKPSAIAIRSEGVSKVELQAKEKPLRDFLTSLSSRNNVRIIDPWEHLASGDAFPSLAENGEPIYMDTHHLRSSYARKHIRYVDVTVGAAGE